MTEEKKKTPSNEKKGPQSEKKRRFTSLNIKTSLLYALLALLNISVITALIFENQSELIVMNTVLQSEKVVYNINDEIQDAVYFNDVKTREDKIKTLVKLFKDLGKKEYMVFNEQADILASMPEIKKLDLDEKAEFTNINRAIFKLENEGKLFYAEISKTAIELIDQEFINFYIPINEGDGKNLIIKLPVSIKGIDEQMELLYKQCALLIVGMIAIVILLAFLYNKMVIRPVKIISKASKNVAEGDYKVQVLVKNQDEIGILSDSFNDMVKSLDITTTRLQKTIKQLERQNDMIQKELDLAKTIQEGMLPKVYSYSRFNLSAYYRALQKISGDYYDVLEFEDGSIGVIIADVSGHGVPAALITIMTKFLFHTYGPEYPDPASLFYKLNLEIGKAVKTDDYVTAFYMIIDPTNRIRFTNAGHHATLLLKKKSGEVEELIEQGFFLGIVEELPVPYNVQETIVEKGDRLILYTDGIPEQKDPKGHEYSNRRLLSEIKAHSDLPLEELVAYIIGDVDKFAKGSERRDDYTFIAIDITADPNENYKAGEKIIPIEKSGEVIKLQSPQEKIEVPLTEEETAQATEMDIIKEEEALVDAMKGRSIKLVKKGENIVHLEIPGDIVSDAFKINGEVKNDFVKINQESLMIDAGKMSGHETEQTPGTEDYEYVRIIQKKGKIIYIDIPKKILSEKFRKLIKDEQKFIRIKNG